MTFVDVYCDIYGHRETCARGPAIFVDGATLVIYATFVVTTRPRPNRLRLYSHQKPELFAKGQLIQIPVS